MSQWFKLHEKEIKDKFEYFYAPVVKDPQMLQSIRHKNVYKIFDHMIKYHMTD